VVTNPRALIIVEAIVCFAIPVYFLFWGVLSLILMIPMAVAGEQFATFNVLVTVAGCFGIVALFNAVRFLTTGNGREAAGSPMLRISAALALLALWAVVTNGFREFSADNGTLILAVMPTLGAAHFLWLVHSRLRLATPNQALERTRDG
jgi:hypothetical protein